MDWLEQELKQALARKAPPRDFAARRSLKPPRWMAAAAAVIVMSGAGAAWREHQGRIAKEQLMTAMRITSAKLNRIQSRVREVRP
jgi:hypothetical protein